MKTQFNGVSALRGLVLAGAVLLATSAFAANKGSFELMHPTQVAGKVLPAGTYKVQWDGSGDEAKASILQGSKEVAAVAVRVVSIDGPSATSNALINVNADGSRSLSQIRFRGKAFAIDFGASGAGAGSSGASR